VLFGNDRQFTETYGMLDRDFTPNHFAGLGFPKIFAEIHLPVLTPWGLDNPRRAVVLTSRPPTGTTPLPFEAGRRNLVHRNSHDF
jgi:hypothetical protein